VLPSNIVLTFGGAKATQLKQLSRGYSSEIWL